MLQRNETQPKACWQVPGTVYGLLIRCHCSPVLLTSQRRWGGDKARLALAGGPSTPRCLSRSTWHEARTAPWSVYPVPARLPPAVYLSRGTRFSPIEPSPSPTTAAQAPRRAWNSLQAVQAGSRGLRWSIRDAPFSPFTTLRSASVVARDCAEKSVCWPS